MDQDDAVELGLEGDAAEVARPDLHLDAHRERVEATLRSLPDIVAVRIVAGMDRPVDELHVVTTPARSPKQTVRDVQSLLYATYGLSIDHRVVSVVQITVDDNGYGARGRLVIEKVQATQDGLEVKVVVTLRHGESDHEGTASGPSSAAGRHRTAARAVLEAVRPVLASNAMLEIEGATVEHLLGQRVAVSFVHLHGGTGQQTLAGTALVTDDDSAAIARSVLDALNRELQRVGGHR